MKVKKGILILGLIAAFCLLMAVKAKSGDEKLNSKLMNEVTFVTDGKAVSENEGKLVLVTGKVNFAAPVEFAEVDYNFNSFKVSRIVEDYLKEKDGEDYEWVERKAPKSLNAPSYDDDDYYYAEGESYEDSSNPTDMLYCETKTVPAKVGDFFIDESYCGTSETLTDKKVAVYNLKFDGIYYSDLNHKNKEKPGDVRVSYKYNGCGFGEDISILAMQKGDGFVPFKVGKKEIFKVYDYKIDTPQALKSKLAKEAKSSFTLKVVFLAIVVVIGLLIAKSGKKSSKKGNEEADSKVEATETAGEETASESEESDNSEETKSEK